MKEVEIDWTFDIEEEFYCPKHVWSIEVGYNITTKKCVKCDKIKVERKTDYSWENDYNYGLWDDSN